VRADPFGEVRVGGLSVAQLTAAADRWRAAGVGVAGVRSRREVVRSAVTWAVRSRWLASDVLAGSRGTPGTMPRRQVPAQTVRTLTAAARGEAVRAEAVHLAQPRPGTRLTWFVAQQRLLQVCLMADTGLRRGELAGLRSDDLLGRVLWLERAVKGEHASGVVPGRGRVGPTKTHRHGRLTVSGSTALCWREHVTTWHGRSALWGSPAVWLFTATPEATEPVHLQTLASRFARVRAAIRPILTTSGRGTQAAMSGETRASVGVAGSSAVSATLHGVRHTVATSLVALGQTLAAQHRLLHSALDTTLRHYVDHTGHGAGPEDRAAIDEFGRLFLPDHPFG